MTSKRLFVYFTIFALGILVGTAWAAQVSLFPATQVDSVQKRAKVVQAAGQLNADFVAQEVPDLNVPEAP